MALTIAVLFAVVAVAAAQVISPYGAAAIDPRIIHGGVAPIAARAGLAREDLAFNSHPQYTFSYNVNEPLTGDAKSQTESRDGDVVQGSYSLVEPDGSVRTVDYTADDVSGFNAVVRKDGGVSPAIAPAAIAAPIAARAPLGLAHPLARTSLGLGGIAHPLARSSLGLGGLAHPLARSSLGLAGLANPLALGGAYGSPYGLGGAYASPYALGGHYGSPYSPYV